MGEEVIEQQINKLIDRLEQAKDIKLSEPDKNLIRLGYWAAVRDKEMEQQPLQAQLLN